MGRRSVFHGRASASRRAGGLRGLGAAALALAFALVAFPAGADPAALCLAAADRAGDAHGVPRAVMRALSRTETGRARGGALQPWPWTVNMEGAGRWFDSRAEAIAFVERSRLGGARSFDIGCFQVNHLYHGEHFASVAEMFDPAVNADYAARFLTSLHRESGDWSVAVGNYHSRTPEFHNRYRDRFARILADGDPDLPLAVAKAPGPAPLIYAASEVTLSDALPGMPASGRIRQRAPLWRTVEAAGPATAGGVALRLAGGSGPLLAAAGRPLLSP